MVFWFSYYEMLDRLKRARSRHVTHGLSDDLSTVPRAEQHLFWLQAISGATAGMSAAIATNPLEVLRIRIQVCPLLIEVSSQ